MGHSYRECGENADNADLIEANLPSGTFLRVGTKPLEVRGEKGNGSRVFPKTYLGGAVAVEDRGRRGDRYEAGEGSDRGGTNILPNPGQDREANEEINLKGQAYKRDNRTEEDGSQRLVSKRCINERGSEEGSRIMEEVGIATKQGENLLVEEEMVEGDMGRGLLRLKKGSKSWKRRVREGTRRENDTLMERDGGGGERKRELNEDEEREEGPFEEGSQKRRKGDPKENEWRVGAEIVPQPHQRG